MGFLRGKKPIPAELPETPLAEAAPPGAPQRDNRAVHLLAIALAGSIAVNLAQAATTVSLAERWRPHPVFVRIGAVDSKILHFSPAETNANTKEIVTEKLLWTYVEARETIDRQTEPDRWKYLSFLTERTLADEFFRTMTIKNPDSPYKKLDETKTTRIAETKRVSTLPAQVFQVEYIVTDYRNFRPITEPKTWVATITVEYRPTSVKYEDRFLNPFGMVVTKYSIAERH